jgi:hypothetical protein
MNQNTFIYLPNSAKHIDYSNQNIIEDDLLQEVKKDMEEDDLLQEIKNELMDEVNVNENNEILNSLSSVLYQLELIKNHFISIDISNNRLMNKGLLKLAEVLNNHENIKYISVVNNKATSSGIFDFVMKILTFPIIPYVDIRGNFGFDLKCVKKILVNLDKEKIDEFKKKIIWYGTEEFNWNL